MKSKNKMTCSIALMSFFYLFIHKKSDYNFFFQSELYGNAAINIGIQVSMLYPDLHKNQAMETTQMPYI
jgi:hypothetical protein